MSNIVKNVNIDPISYFYENELRDLYNFIAVNTSAELKLKANLDRVNLEIARIMGIR